VYIAFYDEYVGRHINNSAGLSIFFFISINLYGIYVNRIWEQNANHYLYNWQYFDKRNRPTHNLWAFWDVKGAAWGLDCRDAHTYRPKVFAELPAKTPYRELTMDKFALIDEMSGLTNYLENFMLQQNLPETTKAHYPIWKSKTLGNHP